MPQPSAADQARAVSAQANAGMIGYPALTALPPDHGLFDAPPVDYGGALRHAAYWMAVAARFLHNRTLAFKAWDRGAISVPYTVLPSTGSAAELSKVLNEAADLVSAAVRDATTAAPQERMIAQTIYAKLRGQAQPTALAKAQEDDDSLTGTLRKLAEQLSKAAKVAAGLMGKSVV